MGPILFLLALIPALAEEQPSSRTLIWPDGTRYVGGVVQGKREGKGTIFWQDGTRFVGHFKNDKKHGSGTLLLPDGTIKNAYFENDVLVASPVSSPNLTLASDALVNPSEESLKKTIGLWADAWSRQDVDEYLTFYADNFTTPGRVSRKAWESRRQQRIKQPEFIKIEIEYTNLSFPSAETAEISFLQKYNSNTFSDVSRKTLNLVFVDKQWKIRRERSR